MLGRTAKRFISYVGNTKLTDLPKPWQTAVDKVCNAQEAAVRVSVPFRSFDIHGWLQNPVITKAEIKYI